jgi:hypothetical protein
MLATQEDINKFEILVDFIEKQLDTEITILPLANEEEYSEFPVDAIVYLNEDLKHHIDLYVNDISNNIETVIACLIHEMGHILCYEQVGNDHTEMDAWDASLLSLPEYLIPNNFEEIKEFALSEYDKVEEIEYPTYIDMNTLNLLKTFFGY